MTEIRKTPEDEITAIAMGTEELNVRESSPHDTASDSIETPSEPGKPIEVSSSSNSIRLQWNAPEHGLKDIVNYEIRYKESNDKKAKWIPIVTETDKPTADVTNLKSGTDYQFKVRAVNSDEEEGPFSVVTEMSTKQSPAKTIQLQAQKMRGGTPSIYKLSLQQTDTTTNPKAKTRKCIFGVQKQGINLSKTIMIVGATGAGKSTLIDGMINYIMGVSWEDDFRLSLVDLTEDEKKRKNNQALSQTEWITCYTIYKVDGSKIDYDLNVIDTPGFGDTRGITRDKAIVDQIREFFTSPGDQGIQVLDAVCFVTQAPLSRLTPSQRYIFDAILSVFGQNIASNIYVLMTFADGNEPPVRDALKEAKVPFQNSFKFNNSALFASVGTSDEANFGSLFWKMGQESFRVFFDNLRYANSISLQLTTEVLQLRKNLEATIQGLQPQIDEGMNQLNTIRQEREILMRHKDNIEAHKNYTEEVDVFKMNKLYLEPGKYVTNCLTCNKTCHYPCSIPDDKSKAGCAAMTNGYCTVCPNKCHWSMHHNNEFRFTTYSVKEKRTIEELKKKYEIAQEGEQKQMSVIQNVQSAFTAIGNKVMKMVQDVRSYINKLNKIALRQNPLSDLEYIDLLIESEKSEKKYGWQERVKLYTKMRKEAEIVASTTNANYKPWGDDGDILGPMM